MYKLLTVLLSAILLCGSALPLSAALVGSSVTGSLQFNGGGPNRFDPTFGFAPAADLNSAGTTVTISSSAVEFGYDDLSSLITADFTDGQVAAADFIEAGGSDFPFTMSFTDSAFSGASISKVSDSFPLTYSLAGDVLTMNWAGGNVTTGQAFAATFNIAPSSAAVPEPSALGLALLSGLAAVALRKRLATH